jgi:hypothetical protein
VIRGAELFAWYGVAVILIAYALVSFDLLASDSLTYQILNATGAAGVMIISFMRRAYQPVVLNLVWTLIAVVAIVRIVV